MFWFGKIKKHLFSAFALLWLLVSSCSKTDFPELKDNGTGFDPATEKEQVNRILQIQGTFQANTQLPLESKPLTINSFTFRVPKPYILHLWPSSAEKTDSIEIGNEMKTFIPVKFSDVEFGQYFNPVNVYLKVTGATGLWKLPVQRDVSNKSGSITLSVPALVREGVLKITLCAELACVYPGYESIRVFTDTVNAQLVVRPPIPCGTTIRGKYGFSVCKFDFGNTTKEGIVKVRFQTGGIPDRLDVLHGGRYVISTCQTLPDPGSFPTCQGSNCWPITNQDWKEMDFLYKPSNGRFAEFYILTWCNDFTTEWILDVSCPK